MTVYKNTSAPVYGIHLKDPISSLTHFAGFLFTIPASSMLLLQGSARSCRFSSMIAFAVFMASMSLLYAASATYHAFSVSPEIDGLLKRVDHCSIFILIAGSYTPVCMIGLGEEGNRLLAVIWIIALAGILFKIFWVYCPKFISSIMYIAMGWACISVLPQLVQNLGSGFWWLLAGGLFYTVGGVLYSLKLNLFPREKETGFGNHELFHLFVMAGSFCHYMLVFQTLTMLG